MGLQMEQHGREKESERERRERGAKPSAPFSPSERTRGVGGGKRERERGEWGT